MKPARNLYLTSVFSLGLALIAILYGCVDSSGRPLSQTAYYFGTSCTLTLFSPKSNVVFNEVFNRFDELEKKMSSSLPGSEVSEINRGAGVKPVPVSGDTFFVIQKGIEFEQLTSGRFDISIGPIVKLWDIGGENQRIPASDEIRDKLPFVGSAGIRLNGASRSVFLAKNGMMLDLGGIAKGFAADEAKKIIERWEVERAIVDIGGNIVTIGQKPEGRPWRIGVQNPFQSRGEYCGVVEMGEGTAVTSGTYERYFERDGKRYHHILDTITGYPVDNSLMSVTIITKSSIKADALSTGVFALGLSDGMSLVEKLEGVEAIFVGRDRVVHLTSGIRDAFQLSDESFTLE